MAEQSSFFNATMQNGIPDRIYKSEDFARFFGTLIGNGIFPQPASGLQVKALNNDMSVTLLPGQGWINGYLYNNTENLTITLGYPDGTLSRIDTIVVRWDLVNREIKSYAKKGEFAITPVAPELTRNEDIYELGIAHIYVGRNVVKINQADITDLRMNNEFCGWVTGLLEQIDTTELFSQIQAVINNSANDIESWLEEVKIHYSQEFYAWFDELRGSLDDDVAGSLLNMILDLNKRVDNIGEELGNLSSTADKITLTESQELFTAKHVDGALIEIMTELKGAGATSAKALNSLIVRL